MTKSVADSFMESNKSGLDDSNLVLDNTDIDQKKLLENQRKRQEKFDIVRSLRLAVKRQMDNNQLSLRMIFRYFDAGNDGLSDFDEF